MKFALFEELGNLPIVTWIFMAVAILLVAFLVVMLLVNYKRRKKAPEAAKPPKNTTRTLVYGALCVALSFLLSYIRLFELPQGGSITLASMLPVALYAYWFGARNGAIAGLAFGLLQFVQEPVAIHWAQPFFDYILAFACLGLAGFFPKSLIAGLAVGGIGRIICSTISGAVFFAEYAPEGVNPWIYSITYNLVASIGPDLIICIIAALALTGVLRRIDPRKKNA